MGPWRHGDTCVISSLFNLSSSFFLFCFFKTFYISRTANPNPVAYSKYRIWQRTTWSAPLSSFWHLSKFVTEQRGEERRRGKLQGRGEVGLETPCFWNCEEAAGGEGFSEWGDQNMCVQRLKEQTEQLQPCIHGNQLRTNLSPRWGLLFLQRKWLKEVKVRKPRTEDETSLTDTYPLSAALLKIFLTANINR